MKGFKTIVAGICIIALGAITWATGTGGLLETLEQTFGVSTAGASGILVSISGVITIILRIVTNTPVFEKKADTK